MNTCYSKLIIYCVDTISHLLFSFQIGTLDLAIYIYFYEARRRDLRFIIDLCRKYTTKLHISKFITFHVKYLEVYVFLYILKVTFTN